MPMVHKRLPKTTVIWRMPATKRYLVAAIVLIVTATANSTSEKGEGGPPRFDEQNSQSAAPL